MQRDTTRPRGIRLNALDRSRVYRIAYVGRRWEVLGPEDSPARAVRATGPDAGAGAGGASTATPPGRHAARGEGTPDDSRAV